MCDVVESIGSAWRAAGRREAVVGGTGANRADPRLGMSGPGWEASELVRCGESTRGLLGTQQGEAASWGCRVVNQPAVHSRRSRSRRGGRSRSVGTIRRVTCARTRRVRGCAGETRPARCSPSGVHPARGRHPRRRWPRLPLLAPRTPTAPRSAAMPPSARLCILVRDVHDWMVFEPASRAGRAFWVTTTHQAPSPTSGASRRARRDDGLSEDDRAGCSPETPPGRAKDQVAAPQT